jgi:hypothetical protein
MTNQSIKEIVIQIEAINQAIAKFWSEADGWAPTSAGALLGKSRLDRQVSLSTSLRHWTDAAPGPLSDGDLILAWTNLGSLLEGTIKTLLSVWYEDYLADIDALKKSGKGFDHKKGTPRDPDGLMLDTLRKLCSELHLVSDDGQDLMQLVQERRNAIHAFQDKSLGDRSEFETALRRYLKMLRDVDSRLPYPES